MEIDNNIDEYVKICIDKLKPYVQELFDKNPTSHDINHLIRVMNIALYLQTKEGGERIIIAISAFLHDVHRVIQNKENKYISPEASIPIVKEIIEKASLNLNEEQIQKILFSIEHHEDKNWDGNNVDDLNTLILQDADNIDGIGAIGIARAFGYGNKYNQPMYIDSVPFSNFEGYREKLKDVSSIHFFHNKLIKLGQNMNTKTAKKIAEKRVEFIKEFIKEFILEWNTEF